MNKTLILILIFLALGLLAYNVTLLDFDTLFEGDSLIAAIGIVASLCAIVLLLIFMTAKKIEEKIKKG
ncbi:hypothetical protein MTsPCn9_13650 [Croceitalea sp. MTPC9]|uniref:hypothetical protein n=1 Tax=unclassified Croceitalea TaxID=2632280 RepID=UPI002B3FEDDA|nr:hypothetical protein MTsPCn6_15480 [Croceitalea sp. MTPC6]GMN16429.1 hypothetical protein MTsPCn9_13650 [Croceitalea sp. MTPC9]